MRTEPSKHYLAVGVDSARSSLGRGLDSMTEYQIELRLMYSYDQEGYRSLEVRFVNKGKNHRIGARSDMHGCRWI